MKILIVEDEKDIANGMRDAVSSFVSEIKEVYVSSNAEDGLQLAQLHRPEIVVTDIVLPEMSGLEMAEKMTADDYRPRIIIVSGYNDFQYVRHSLKLGAVDYFLKPFDRGEFINRIQAVAELISEDQGRQLREQQKLQTAQTTGNKAFIDKMVLGLCMKPTPLQEYLLHWLHMWNLTWLSDLPLYIVTFGLNDVDRSQDEDGRLADDLAEIGQTVDELWVEGSPCFRLANSQKEHILITALDDVNELLERIRSRVLEQYQLELCFGVSKRIESFNRIASGYEQSVQAFKLAALHDRSETVFFSGDAEENDVESLSVDVIYYAICSADADTIGRLASQWITKHTELQPAYTIGDLSKLCMNLLSQVYTMLRDRAGITQNSISITLWEQFDQSTSRESTAQLLAEQFMNIASQAGLAHKNSIVERAKKWIEVHFAQDISLQEVSNQLEISSYWLSHLFKKEEGRNFVDYVTDVRMNEAKRLLRESNFKIYEIAEAVGYKDLQYFGKVFKRKTGLSPKEFKYGR